MNIRLTNVVSKAAVFVIVLSGCSQKSAEQAVDVPEPKLAEKPPVLARTLSPDGASVYFVTPANGATLSNPVRIEFGIDGMAVVKAGVNDANSGHHHLLIDTTLPALGLPIPADDQHVHFGDGSTATEITLEPGEHTLQMLLGDYLHIPHDPAMVSEPITITVE